MTTQRIRAILVYILGLNWLVSFAKLVCGYIIMSNAMVADGYHSFADGASNIIGLFGIWLASRPRDETHPYGRKKYETFASLGIAFLLFLVSIRIVYSSVMRFSQDASPNVTILSFVVMLSTLIINLAVMLYEYRAGKKLNSDILIADSMHTRADIFTSISVIFALVAVKFGWPLLDPIAAIIIAIFIIYTGFEILKESSSVLCDTAPVDAERIEKLVLGIEGVSSVHKIRTRGRCDDVHVDLHVEVRPDMHMKYAHKISYEIEGQIKKNIFGVTDVIIHMEPERL
ncbi:MAG TPA: cation transporter [Candidatus Omnitrophica bacterium]|nr:cation transporter [Candidatus Omnitrophota bacterium]